MHYKRVCTIRDSHHDSFATEIHQHVSVCELLKDDRKGGLKWDRDWEVV